MRATREEMDSLISVLLLNENAVEAFCHVLARKILELNSISTSVVNSPIQELINALMYNDSNTTFMQTSVRNEVKGQLNKVISLHMKHYHQGLTHEIHYQPDWTDQYASVYTQSYVYNRPTVTSNI